MKSSAVLLWFYNQQCHNSDKQDLMPMLCQVIMTTLNPVRIRINWITFVKFAERERHEPGGLGINIREYRGAAPVSVYSTALILWARQPRPGSDCSHSGLWEAQIWSNMKYKYQPFKIQCVRQKNREEIAFSIHLPINKFILKGLNCTAKFPCSNFFHVQIENGFVVAEWLS